MGAGILLAALLLATQILLPAAPLSLVLTYMYMLLKCLMAHWYSVSDLLGAVLQVKHSFGLFINLDRYRWRIRGLDRQFTGMRWAVPARACVEARLIVDLRPPITLAICVILCRTFIRLAIRDVSISLRWFVIHRATSTCRSGTHEC